MNPPKDDIEKSLSFTPRFNTDGLIPCVAVSARDGAVLMLAWMNQQAIEKTLETREAHYWSRSRGKLWRKGETSGQVQKVVEMRIDCDQDCLLLSVEMLQPEKSCHTGRKSCFYRTVKDGSKLAFNDLDE